MSLEANLLDLRATSDRLWRSSDDVSDLGRQVRRELSALPLSAALLAPSTAAGVGEQGVAVVYGPGGLTVLSVRLQLISRLLRTSAWAYAEADRRSARAMESLRVSVGAPVVLASVTKTGGTSVFTVVARDPRLFMPLAAPSAHTGGLVAHQFVNDLNRTVYRDPWLIDMAVSGAQSALSPLSFETQARLLLAGLQEFGLAMDDRPLTVTPVAAVDADGRAAQGLTDASAPPDAIAVPDATVAAPGDVAGLLRTQSAITTTSAAGAAGSRVRVQRIQGADGQHRWIVNIPGTQTWSPNSPSNPSDGPTNLAAIGGVTPRLYAAIAQSLSASMRSAGVRPGSEPVLLSGHSQGGIIATRLAADPEFRRRYAVTSVVTAGSPVSRIEVPRDIRVLSLEHRSDLVPRLDAKADPDTVNRVRVVLEPTPAPPGTHGECTDDTAMSVHGSSRYALTTEQQLGRSGPLDPQLRQWYADHDGFLRGRATTYDYLITRPQTAQPG